MTGLAGHVVRFAVHYGLAYLSARILGLPFALVLGGWALAVATDARALARQQGADQP